MLPVWLLAQVVSRQPGPDDDKRQKLTRWWHGGSDRTANGTVERSPSSRRGCLMVYAGRPTLGVLAEFRGSASTRQSPEQRRRLREFVAAVYQRGRSLRELAEMTVRTQTAVRRSRDEACVERRASGAPRGALLSEDRLWCARSTSPTRAVTSGPNTEAETSVPLRFVKRFRYGAEAVRVRQSTPVPASSCSFRLVHHDESAPDP